jgi:prepilin-type N-terminal cleavage/methylation domain
MKKHNKGFTLVELLLSTAMVAVIIGALAFMFQVVVGSWSTQGARAGLGVSVSKAVREMTRDLRNAKEIGSVNANEIRFTADGTTYYIYYLYNTAGSYQLKKATLLGKIDGTFVSGSGNLIARDILPPPTSTLSAGVPITIDLTAQRGNSIIRSAGKVRPRNI